MSNYIFIKQRSSGGGGAVASVNGQTGVVVLDATDIGLGNVENAAQIRAALDYSAKGSPAAGDKLVILDQSGSVPKIIDWNQLPGAASVDTSQEFWANDPTFADTDAFLTARGATSQLTLPAYNAGKRNLVTVRNRSSASVLIRPYQSHGIILGRDYPEDGTSYSAHHDLAGHSAITAKGTGTVSFWFYLNSTLSQSYMFYQRRASGTDTLEIRTAPDYASAWTNKHLAIIINDGTLRIDKRYVITPQTLYHVALSWNLATPAIQCLLNGSIATEISGGTLTAGTVTPGAGSAPKVGSAISGSRRAMCGVIAGLQEWDEKVDLSTAEIQAKFIDGGAPTQRGFTLNSVAPQVVFNGAATSFANTGTRGGTWTDATPSGVGDIPATATFDTLKEAILGGNITLPAGSSQTLMRAAGMGLWVPL